MEIAKTRKEYIFQGEKNKETKLTKCFSNWAIVAAYNTEKSGR